MMKTPYGRPKGSYQPHNYGTQRGKSRSIVSFDSIFLFAKVSEHLSAGSCASSNFWMHMEASIRTDRLKPGLQRGLLCEVADHVEIACPERNHLVGNEQNNGEVDQPGQ